MLDNLIHTNNERARLVYLGSSIEKSTELLIDVEFTWSKTPTIASK